MGSDRPAALGEADLNSVAAEWRRRFNAGDYYGAHEVAEDAWHAYRGRQRDFLKGLVQLAVSLHHHFAANPHGASVKWASSRSYLSRFEPECLGLNLASLLKEVERFYDEQRPGEPKEGSLRPHA